jgi:hypothetical protein
MPIKTLAAGQKITESWLAGLVNEVNRLSKLTATPPLRIIDNSAGMVLALDEKFRIVRFKLMESLDVGGSAVADITHWDGSEWVTMDDVITVYDALDTFYGEINQVGFAYFHTGAGRWLILQMACGVPSSSSSA